MMSKSHQEAAPTCVTLRNGTKRIFRHLERSDRSTFGDFLESLSCSIRASYNPHPLNRNEATRICRSLPEVAAVRQIAVRPSEPIIAGYVLADLVISEKELARFRIYGVELGGVLARVAPVVADGEQGVGLGTALLRHVLRLLEDRGIDDVILFGGTKAANHRAVHMYERLGFIRAGEFYAHGVDNYDMYLSLSR